MWGEGWLTHVVHAAWSTHVVHAAWSTYVVHAACFAALLTLALLRWGEAGSIGLRRFVQNWPWAIVFAIGTFFYIRYSSSVLSELFVAMIDPNRMEGFRNTVNGFGTYPHEKIWRAAVWIAVAAWAEEAAFRGIFLERLSRVVPAVPAVLATSVLFALWHLPSLGGFFALLIMSTIFCAAYLVTRSLWIPWLCHAVANLIVAGWVIYVAR
jgi:membrane protease YdiL (CAAX protease family)